MIDANTTTAKGVWAESVAANYLQRQGLKQLTTNYRCRWGEIDIICADKTTFVFVEVRYRAGNAERIRPEETVDERKRMKLMKTASHYLQRHAGAVEYSCRFDVIAIAGHRLTPSIVWFRDAFQS